jgi:RNA polymerase sigma-70 factor (ECF subfamily)
MQDESGTGRFVVAPSDPSRVAERFIAACAGGDIDALMELLDPNVVGEADLGDGYPRPLQAGRDRVARNLLRFFRGDGGVTLVSHPLNGELGVLAFHRGTLVALMSMETRDGLIVDIHAVADPAMFAAAGLPTQPEA